MIFILLIYLYYLQNSKYEKLFVGSIEVHNHVKTEC